ncbi:MAG: hypothetical protein ACYC61_10675 [Isosphaeraceae bacterium]
MTDKLFDPKREGQRSHPEPYQHHLNPDAATGQDFALTGPHLEKDNSRTAYDEKEAHRQLVDWTDDDLKQIPLLPAGARLEQGATYVDLRDPARREFTATGEMQVPIDGLYVPRSEVDFRTWNRLLGNRTPERPSVVGSSVG